MAIDREQAAHRAICYNSTWRALPDGPGRPHHYTMLSAKEIVELVETGGFTLPDDAVPDSVRRWRKLQETAAEIITLDPGFESSVPRGPAIEVPA